MEDLMTWLHTQLDDDERWARAASQVYTYAVGNPKPPEAGVHWTWVVGENWTPTTPDPVTEEWVGGEPGQNVNLATVEQWSAGNWGIEGAPERFSPQTYADSIVEMDASAAGHIARWDPARVLAEVKAKRRILDEYDRAVQRQADNSAKFVRMTDGRYSNDPDYVAVKTHGWELMGQVQGLRAAVVEIAQPYAGQPGWREEWQA